MPKCFFRWFFTALIIGVISIPADAQGLLGKLSWFGQGSVLFFPEDNDLRSDPMPILPSPGIGAAYPFTDILWAELTLDFYMTNYGYEYGLGRPIPLAIENRYSLVIGSVLAFQAAGYFNLGSSVTLRAYAGPAADLRIVIIALDLRSDDMEQATRQTNSVRDYFWSQGRWLMPVAGLGVDFDMNERFKIGIDLRTWMPVYRLWTGEDLPAIEGWRFGAGLRFTIR